jgi:hypothetical protein
MSQRGPLAVFSFWILVFVAIVSFQLYRARYARKHRSPSIVRGGHGSRTRSQKTPRSAVGAAKNDKNIAAATQSVIEVEAAAAEPEGPMLRFTGYRRVLAGELCWWLLILTSLHWIGIYVLVLVDAYWACQMTGIDNTCFYGTYFIFGSYDRNGTVSKSIQIPRTLIQVAEMIMLTCKN